MQITSTTPSEIAMVSSGSIEARGPSMITFARLFSLHIRAHSISEKIEIHGTEAISYPRWPETRRPSGDTSKNKTPKISA